ncbi:hypothetical protein GIB67_015965 [Kingdonia uniflora]|uniref:TF-B3 domain-containing protein n=1 Tax=Kingdonia uniflora TaxID=39325 RepID=A0A7J7PCS6_9MAGN|nr:hypothetical protein GIB67_015965 [Kingdonia uniflora]
MGTKPKGSCKPNFYKILFGDFSQKLGLPSAFVKNFNGILRRKYYLKGPTGKSWPVLMKKVDDDLFFHKGWQAFVRDHSLEYGDFLVFSYSGNSKFNVKVYDKSTCEKMVSLTKMKTGRTNSCTEKSKQEETKRPSSSYNCDDDWKKRAVVSNKINCGLVKPKRTPNINIRRKGAIEVPCSGKSAKDNSRPIKMVEIKEAIHPVNYFKLREESYRKFLRERCLTMICRSRRHHMRFPFKIAAKLELKNKGCAILQDPHGKLWPVKISLQSDGRFELSKGWKDFWDANKLAAGDTCQFEFLQGKDNPVRVVICREAINPTAITMNCGCVKPRKSPVIRVEKKGASKVPSSGKYVKQNVRSFNTDETKKTNINFAKKRLQSYIKIEGEDCFSAICRPSRKYFMTVPNQLAAELNLKRKVNVMLNDPHGKSWAVKIAIRRNGRLDLGYGWLDFWNANKLAVGDTCVFKFLQTKDDRVKVDIFRGVKSPLASSVEPASQSWKPWNEVAKSVIRECEKDDNDTFQKSSNPILIPTRAIQTNNSRHGYETRLKKQRNTCITHFIINPVPLDGIFAKNKRKETEDQCDITGLVGRSQSIGTDGKKHEKDIDLKNEAGPVNLDNFSSKRRKNVPNPIENTENLQEWVPSYKSTGIQFNTANLTVSPMDESEAHVFKQSYRVEGFC